jgi:hypothetical protein
MVLSVPQHMVDMRIAQSDSIAGLQIEAAKGFVIELVEGNVPHRHLGRALG